MEIQPIRFIMPSFSFEDGAPAANIYIHLDILGDDQIRYQHFKTDDQGRLLSGNKPAMVREGEYDLCATSNDVEDDIMETYEPFHVTIEEQITVAIPADIVVEWEWKNTDDYIKSLENEKALAEVELEEMQKQLSEMEQKHEGIEEDGTQIEAPDSMSPEEKKKLQTIYSNIEIAKKKIDENWELVEKGKTKLKILLDKQEDTLEYLEIAENEKSELKKLRDDMEKKKRQIDLVFNAIVGNDERIESLLAEDGSGEGGGQFSEGDLDDVYSSPDIETLKRIRQHIISINEKRQQLEIAREKILEAKDQLKNRKDGMVHLSEEMAQTIQQYDQLLGEIRQERETLSQIKEKLFDGWERLKVEYGERVKEAETQYRVIEKEKAILKVKQEKVKDHFFEGKDRIHGDQQDVLHGKKTLAKLGSELKQHSSKIKEAIIAKKQYEDRYDALKEDENNLEKREIEYKRQNRKMERDHSLRMEAYAQNDSDIEAEFQALDEMRSLVKSQRKDFVKDRLDFLKESMYYECPVCGGTIPVKTSKRPLRVECPSCTTEFNLKVKQKYQCPECSETIAVTTSKRPINVKCQKCASEFIIRKPFKHEEEILPDKVKASVKVS